MDQTTLFIIILALGLFLILGVAFALQRLAKKRQEASGGATPRTANTPEAIAKLPVDAQVEQMRKSIRSWGWTMLAFGVLALFLGQVLSSPWGIIQIMIGLASFYFVEDYAMFMVYAGAFLWAGVMNAGAALSGTATWGGAAIIQLVMAFSNYRLFTTYQNATRARHAATVAPDPATAPGGPPPLWETPAVQVENTRAQRIFPWLAIVLGLGGMLFFVLIFIGFVLIGILELATETPPVMAFLFDLSALLAVMAVPVSIAALRGGYKPKAASIVGLVSGLIMLAVYLWLLFSG